MSEYPHNKYNKAGPQLQLQAKKPGFDLTSTNRIPSKVGDRFQIFVISTLDIRLKGIWDYVVLMHCSRRQPSLLARGWTKSPATRPLSHVVWLMLGGGGERSKAFYNFCLVSCRTPLTFKGATMTHDDTIQKIDFSPTEQGWVSPIWFSPNISETHFECISLTLVLTPVADQTESSSSARWDC